MLIFIQLSFMPMRPTLLRTNVGVMHMLPPFIVGLRPVLSVSPQAGNCETAGLLCPLTLVRRHRCSVEIVVTSALVGLLQTIYCGGRIY